MKNVFEKIIEKNQKYASLQNCA